MRKVVIERSKEKTRRKGMNFSKLPDDFRVCFWPLEARACFCGISCIGRISTAIRTLQHTRRQRYAGLLNKILSGNCGNITEWLTDKLSQKAHKHSRAIESGFSIL